MQENSGKKYKIIFTGGGTGGHVFPIVAIIRELQKILPLNIIELHYIGPQDETSRSIEKEGVKIKYIQTGKIRRYGGVKPLLANFIDIFFKIPYGIMQSFFTLYFLSPDLIFSKGGYGSFPVVLASKFLGAPVFLHESDSIPGAANKFLQKFSKQIFVSFQETSGIDKNKMIVTGNPVREEILQGSKEKGKERFNLKGEKPVLLVLGGSQGSERINDIFLAILTSALRDFEIIHQCGTKNCKQVSAEAKAVITEEGMKENYHPYPFLNEEELRDAYQCADLVVSRAGSGSIFEIAANHKASFLLPLPESAQNHQVKNAYLYASSGAALVMEEGNFTPRFFFEKIKETFSPITQIRDMEKNAKEFSTPEAGRMIAVYIKKYLTQYW